MQIDCFEGQVRELHIRKYTSTNPASLHVRASQTYCHRKQQPAATWTRPGVLQSRSFFSPNNSNLLAACIVRENLAAKKSSYSLLPPINATRPHQGAASAKAVTWPHEWPHLLFTVFPCGLLVLLLPISLLVNWQVPSNRYSNLYFKLPLRPL